MSILKRRKSKVSYFCLVLSPKELDFVIDTPTEEVLEEILEYHDRDRDKPEDDRRVGIYIRDIQGIHPSEYEPAGEGATKESDYKGWLRNQVAEYRKQEREARKTLTDYVLVKVEETGLSTTEIQFGVPASYLDRREGLFQKIADLQASQPAEGESEEEQEARIQEKIQAIQEDAEKIEKRIEEIKEKRKPFVEELEKIQNPLAEAAENYRKHLICSMLNDPYRIRKLDRDGSENFIFKLEDFEALHPTTQANLFRFLMLEIDGKDKSSMFAAEQTQQPEEEGVEAGKD